MGTGILDAKGRPDSVRTGKSFRIGEYWSEGVSVYENIAPIDDETLATIYRGVDFTVCSSRAEGFGVSVAESMASGTPAIFGDFGATKELATPGALLLRGTQSRADYSDKGFGDVGDWWEPSVEHLTARLIEAHDTDAARYRTLAEDGVRLIRTKFSWRATCFAIREVLISEDEGRVPVKRTQTARQIGSGIGWAHWKGVIAGAVRRFGVLRTFFYEQLEERGIKDTITASVDTLIVPFARYRASRLRERAVQALRNVRDRLLAATGQAQRRPGVLFIGYAEGGLGLGQAFRGTLAAAAAADIPFAIYPFCLGTKRD